MFNSTVLEVATSLVFIYFLLSLICSAIQEWIAQFLSLRAKNLAEGIKNLLGDHEGTGIANQLYAHGLIQGLTPPSNKTAPDKKTAQAPSVPPAVPPVPNPPLDLSKGPSYIDAKTFATALLDNLNLILPPDPTSAAQARIDAASTALAGAPSILQAALKPLIRQANGDVATLQKSVEDWYDAAMDRVSGWYRRKVQWIMLGIALVVAIGFNADTVHMVDTLSKDPASRAAIVKVADTQVSSKSLTELADKAKVNDILSQLDGVPLPFGWNEQERVNTTSSGWFVLGWILTTLALAMGAPFWFSLLKTLVNLRHTGEPPAKAADSRKGDAS